jgi:hypothetical protein
MNNKKHELNNCKAYSFFTFGLLKLLFFSLVLCDPVRHPPHLQHHFLYFTIHLYPLIIIMTEWALFLFFSMIIRLEDENLVVDVFPIGQRLVLYALIEIYYWGYILF